VLENVDGVILLFFVSRVAGDDYFAVQFPQFRESFFGVPVDVGRPHWGVHAQSQNVITVREAYFYSRDDRHIVFVEGVSGSGFNGAVVIRQFIFVQTFLGDFFGYQSLGGAAVKKVVGDGDDVKTVSAVKVNDFGDGQFAVAETGMDMEIAFKPSLIHICVPI